MDEGDLARAIAPIARTSPVTGQHGVLDFEDTADNIAVIAVGGYAIPGITERTKQDGFDDYAVKPLVRAELIKVLNSALTRTNGRKSL